MIGILSFSFAIYGIASLFTESRMKNRIKKLENRLDIYESNNRRANNTDNFHNLKRDI